MIHVLNLTYRADTGSTPAWTPEHRAWVRDQHDQGRVLLSGPRAGGAVIITADLSEAEARLLAEEDPWHRHGVTSYEIVSFEARNAAPGLALTPGADASVFLINVAETGDAPATVDFLASAVEHVAATATGFRGSRLLTSVEGDTVVNLASWASEKEFAAIFDDPGFTSRYAAFKETVTGARYRLYRTSRVIGPRLP